MAATRPSARGMGVQTWPRRLVGRGADHVRPSSSDRTPVILDIVAGAVQMRPKQGVDAAVVEAAIHLIPVKYTSAGVVGDDGEFAPISAAIRGNTAQARWSGGPSKPSGFQVSSGHIQRSGRSSRSCPALFHV